MDLGTGAAIVPSMPGAGVFKCLQPEGGHPGADQEQSRPLAQELRQDPVFPRLRGAANFYVAALLLPKTGGAPAIVSNCTAPTSDEFWRALAGQETPGMMEAR